MSLRTCFICKTDEEEAEHLIGIEFNPLDQEREDVFLCADCIDSAYQTLEERRFKDKVGEAISDFLENQDDEIEISEK